MKDNTICGIFNEYYESGKLKSESIVIQNLHVKTFFYGEDGNIIERFNLSPDLMKTIRNELPEYLDLAIGNGEKIDL